MLADEMAYCSGAENNPIDKLGGMLTPRKHIHL